METTGRNVPLADVADAVEEGSGAEDHCGACDVLALASNHAFDGLVGRVHFEFLERIGDDRGVREHRLRSLLD